MPDGIPAIVTKDLFDRVQEKLAKNKKLLHGTSRRMIIFLLQNYTVANVNLLWSVKAEQAGTRFTVITNVQA